MQILLKRDKLVTILSCLRIKFEFGECVRALHTKLFSLKSFDVLRHRISPPINFPLDRDSLDSVFLLHILSAHYIFHFSFHLTLSSLFKNGSHSLILVVHHEKFTFATSRATTLKKDTQVSFDLLEILEANNAHIQSQI